MNEIKTILQRFLLRFVIPVFTRRNIMHFNVLTLYNNDVDNSAIDFFFIRKLLNLNGLCVNDDDGL